MEQEDKYKYCVQLMEYLAIKLNKMKNIIGEKLSEALFNMLSFIGLVFMKILFSISYGEPDKL